MEILAPVGGKEQLIAAVRSGANAVYLGAKGFNARRNADNFESCDLAETVAYCHSHNVRVHITLNTLVMDEEMMELIKTADEIASAGVDAVIVQDMAVMHYLKTRYPRLRLHASTQSVVHNAAGAKYMKELGYDRVVLARELSIDEMRKIHDEVDIELEAFVHGALCMCVSGACYMSSMIGGRSGNRGLCAQPCRLNFVSGGREYALSLKDMSHIKHVKELSDAGICSLKIEGRMKRPEYVAAAVTACKNALEGKSYDEETLRAVFSRGGFTDGYYTGNRDLSMFGHREKEDVVAAARVLKNIENTYHKENQLLPVDMELTLSDTELCKLTVSCMGKTAEVFGEAAIIATGRPTDENIAKQNLSKLGGTQYYLGGMILNTKDGLMAPPSMLNSMRREAIEKLNALLSEKIDYEKQNVTDSELVDTPRGEMKLWARFFKVSQLSNAEGYEKVIIPLFELSRHTDIIEEYGDKIVCELPTVAFPEYEDKVFETLIKLKNAGLKSIFAENIYAIQMGKDLALEIIGGSGLNILNSRALKMYGEQGVSAATLSFELNMAKAESIRSSIKTGLIGYGYLPLMRVRNCPAKTNKGCRGCNGDRSLIDRKNEKFPVLCENRLYSTILNCVPLHIGDKKIKNQDFLLLYFTKEPREECERIFKEFQQKSTPQKERTGGLYYRTLA